MIKIRDDDGNWPIKAFRAVACTMESECEWCMRRISVHRVECCSAGVETLLWPNTERRADCLTLACVIFCMMRAV